MTIETTAADIIVDDSAELVPVDDVVELQRITARTARLRAAKDELRAAYEYAQVLTHSTSINPEFQAYAERVKRRKVNGQWRVENLPPLGEQAIYNLAVAIIYGDKLGWTPEESAMRVFSVHGKPSIEAKDAIAFITAFIEVRLADGRTKPFVDGGDWIWPVEESATKAVWKSRRNGVEVSSEWTMARAEQAKYTENEKYQTNPTEMLRWKAAMEVARIQWMDVLRGIAYSREELDLETPPVTVASSRPSSVPGRKGVGGLEQMLAARNQRAVESMQDSPAEPTVEPEVVASVEEEPAASKEQIDRVTDLLKAEKYMQVDQDALAYLSGLITPPRDLSKLTDLTAREAAEIITTLSQPVNG